MIRTAAPFGRAGRNTAMRGRRIWNMARSLKVGSVLRSRISSAGGGDGSPPASPGQRSIHASGSGSSGPVGGIATARAASPAPTAPSINVRRSIVMTSASCQCLVAEIAEARLATAGGVKRRAQAQEIISNIVMIAGDFHLDVELLPGRAVIGAGMQGKDVALVGQADAQAPDRPAAARALQAVAMHHQAMVAEAEARVEAAIVEEQ